jgi:hypothetical protein
VGTHMDARDLARPLVGYVTALFGEEAVQDALVRLVAEVLELEPGVRERFVDALMTDLKEEVARREDPRHARAVVGLIEEIEERWRNER